MSQILKSALASNGGYCIYGRAGASRFINIAVLNQTSHTLCWFTCHGRLFDSTKLTGQEFEQIASKQIDPFELYQNICSKYLTDLAAAKDIYRVYGDVQLLDKLNGNYRALFAMETVQAAQTPLQKLIAIENIKKKILTQLAYLNCGNPFVLHDDSLYKISKEQAGAMIQTKDSTVYYNIDPTSAVAKIILYKKSTGKLYIQNRFSEIIDSVAIQPEKYDLLQKEKTDVFLLYRGWLEMQWQGILSAIRRQSAGMYSQVNVQNEKEVKELYNQLNAIGAKINQMNSPEEKSIDQAVYDTYRNETSEINYIPLLGIGYNLTQTRGKKEYELTNHLGNVLATVSDKKIGVSSSSDSSLIDHYEPDVVSAQDYYPFGMLQPGRSYLLSNGKYRYGFNGKENDNEVKGDGNQQDYGMRIYDPRLGRFLSVDPVTGDYPWYTPFQFAGNTPIQAIDVDGLEPSYAYKDSRGYQLSQAGDNLAIKRLPIGHQQFMLDSYSFPSAAEEAEKYTQLLDWIPFVGQLKGARESVTGRRMFTNEEIDGVNRIWNLLPGFGPGLGSKQTALAKTTQAALKKEADAAFIASRKSWVISDGVGGQAAFNKSIILKPDEELYVSSFVAASTGYGYSNLKFNKALSTDALRELSMRLGNVEVAQVFVKQKYGGYYSILQGSRTRIEITNYLDGTPYLISHVHPSGNPFPSTSDKSLLDNLKKVQEGNKMPIQNSSQIVPLGKSNKKFNKDSETVGE